VGSTSSARRWARVVGAAAGIAVLLLALAGCSGQGESPRRVTEEFWAAAAGGDWETTRRLSTAPDPHQVEALLADGELGELTFGEAMVARSSALVPTFARRDDELTVAFNTNLIHFDEGWRVDVEATRSELRRARAVASLESAADAARRGAGELGEALEQGARDAARALERALEEMQRELDSRRERESR